jgi:2-oxoglutarate dehydrogenase E2 component (dihydrolipoamide succinyltransferase)
MTAVVRHRAAHKENLAQKGINLSFTPYFVAAVAAALRENPAVNSSWTDVGLMLSQRIHVGIAVAVRDGLVVPVIRDADELNLQGLARTVNDLAGRARRGELSPDDVRGGTFTVTNHGTSGSLLGTPIINQPQAAILGVGKIGKRAVVNSGGSVGAPADPLLPSADDTISIRPMSYLSLAFDHRILDGFGADSFLADVVKRLENWGA